MAEGEIIITITLKQSPRGTLLNVVSDPQDAYGDVLIEACRRAATFLERELLAARIVKAQHPRLIG